MTFMKPTSPPSLQTMTVVAEAPQRHGCGGFVFLIVRGLLEFLDAFAEVLAETGEFGAAEQQHDDAGNNGDLTGTAEAKC